MKYFDIFDIFNVLEGSGTAFGDVHNMCFQPLEQVGDILGGTTSPDVTADSTPIYSVTANISSGEFISRFGVAGDEKLDNTMHIIYVFDNIHNTELFWDDVNLYYTGIDLEAATYLQTLVGTNVCFLALAEPDLLIHYDMTMESE